jgi:hypothetical protein
MNSTGTPQSHAAWEDRRKALENELAMALLVLGLPPCADVTGVAWAIAEAGEGGFPGATETVARIRDGLEQMAACEAKRRAWVARQPSRVPPQGEAPVFTIEPYPDHDGWVFDDPARDLWREPLRIGIERLLDRECGAQTPAERRRIAVSFSRATFPGANVQLTLKQGVFGGNWYGAGEVVGWLCPALYLYFETAPNELYLRFHDGGD